MPLVGAACAVRTLAALWHEAWWVFFGVHMAYSGALWHRCQVLQSCDVAITCYTQGVLHAAASSMADGCIKCRVTLRIVMRVLDDC